MKKIGRVLLSTSLVILIALLTFNATLDFTTSYSLKEETKEAETIDNEETKKVEEEQQKEESNSKVLFYSGMVLLIVLVGAMLIVFLSKSEDLN